MDTSILFLGPKNKIPFIPILLEKEESETARQVKTTHTTR